MIKVALVCDCEGLTFLEQGNPDFDYFDMLKFYVNKNIFARFRYSEFGFTRIYPFCVEKKLPITMMLMLKKFLPINGAPEWIEFGSHTWNHQILTTRTDDELKYEVDNAFNLVSFTPPMWKVAERELTAIRDAGYKVCTFRGFDKHIWSANNLPLAGGNLKLIYVSAPYDKSEHLEKIQEDLVQYKDKDILYCISTHDFVHKDESKLQKLYDVIKNYECITLRQLV